MKSRKSFSPFAPSVVLGSISVINTGLRTVFGAILLFAASYYLEAEEFIIWSLISACGGIIFGTYLLLGTVYGRYMTFIYSGLSPHEFRRRTSVAGRPVSKRGHECAYVVEKMISSAVLLICAVVCALFVTFLGFSEYQDSNTIVRSDLILISLSIVSSTFSLLAGKYYANIIGANEIVRYTRLQIIFWLLGLLSIIILILSKILPAFGFLIVGSTYFCCIGPLCAGLISNRARFEKTLPNRSFVRRVRVIIWFDVRKNLYSFILGISARNFSTFFAPLAVEASFETAEYLFIKRLFDVIESLSMSIYQAFSHKISTLDFVGHKDISLLTLQNLTYVSFLLISVSTTIIIFASELTLLQDLAILDGSLDSTLVLFFMVSTIISRWGGGWMFVMNCLNRVVEHKVVLPFFATNISLSILLFDFLGVFAFPLASLCSVLIGMCLVGRSIYSTIGVSFLAYEKRSILLFGAMAISGTILSILMNNAEVFI